jgi:hypothetical protein
LSLGPGLLALSVRAGPDHRHRATASPARTTTIVEAMVSAIVEAAAWERQGREPARAHLAFRIYRDLPVAHRRLDTVASRMGVTLRSAQRWAEAWHWADRADAWDDACHQVEDTERLEAIRDMHAIHRKAGRAAMQKAMEALDRLPVDEMPPATIARLLELGAKLERSTLIVSVEELQGIEVDDDESDDPWDVIARELDPTGEPQQ